MNLLNCPIRGYRQHVAVAHMEPVAAGDVHFVGVRWATAKSGILVTEPSTRRRQPPVSSPSLPPPKGRPIR